MYEKSYQFSIDFNSNFDQCHEMFCFDNKNFDNPSGNSPPIPVSELVENLDQSETTRSVT